MALAMVEKLEGVCGRAQIDAVRRELLLPDTLPTYRIDSEAVPIMVFAARAGSTYSGQLLARHPAFGRMAEWFNPGRLRRMRSEDSYANDGAVVQQLIDEHAKEVFGVECTLFGLISCALLGFLDQVMPRVQFILLKRRDRVAHAVSLTKAQMSGQYSSAQRAKQTIGVEDYDAERIGENYRLIHSVYEMIDGFLAEMPGMLLTIHYEDIVADPAAFQSGVFRQLELTPASLASQDTAVRKIGDEVNTAWIERFRETL